MHRANHREIVIPMFTEPVFSEALIKNLLHLALAFNTLFRVIKEILVKDNPGMRMPPGGVKDDVDGQMLVTGIHVVEMRVLWLLSL